LKKYLILLLFTLSLLYAASPSRAMLYSAFVPGGGQIYNKAYLKAGVVVGLQSYLLANTLHQDALVQDYKSKINKENDAFLIQSYRDKQYEARQARTSGIWWMAIVSTLSVLDAYVDAHLTDFEEQREGLHLRFEDEKITLIYRY